MAAPMNADRLLAHYEQIADAPDAIACLRRFILDLAVRGKLVPQDPNDEPASELLKRIATEKARLVKKGEIKEAKPIAHLTKGPREVPIGWTLVPLGMVVNSHLGGGTPSKSNFAYWDGDIRWASVKDVGKLKFLDETKDRITEEGLANSSANLIPAGNLIVVTRMGLGQLSINRVPVAINQDLRALFLSAFVNIEYVYNFFLTHGIEGTGLTVKGIKIEELLGIPFPLPPLAEQHRIVAKVDELMGLCDQLEAARAGREAVRDALAAASLARLNTPDPETFKDDARFTLDALPALTTHPDQIKRLRQTILNLAVRGKLVRQDANDEPASDLLKRIAAEKARLVKAGVVPQKKDPVRDPRWMMEHCPPSWVQIALGEVCDLVTSGSRGWAEFYAKSGPGFVRAQNIRFGKLRLDDLAFVNPPTKSEGSRTQVAKGDLLIVITGAGVTNPALLDCDLGEAYVSQHVGLVRPSDKRLSDWLLLSLMADSGGRAELVERAYGAGKPGLNLDNIRSLCIPLPPITEQHRIVAKVDALMALCDQLEASLITTATTRRHLLDALLVEALAPVDARELEVAV
jgi:type I restriction enzyme S subunit